MKNHIKYEVDIYSILCMGCNKNYIGETSRLMKKHIHKQTQDYKIGDERNMFVKNSLEAKHNLNFKCSKMFVNIHNKHCRKMVESSIIFNCDSIKQMLVYFNLSSYWRN